MPSSRRTWPQASTVTPLVDDERTSNHPSRFATGAHSRRGGADERAGDVRDALSGGVVEAMVPSGPKVRRTLPDESTTVGFGRSAAATTSKTITTPTSAVQTLYGFTWPPSRGRTSHFWTTDCRTGSRPRPEPTIARRRPPAGKRRTGYLRAA